MNGDHFSALETTDRQRGNLGVIWGVRILAQMTENGESINYIK